MSRQKVFGRNVRKLRRDKDLSQEAFAFDCGLHRTYIGAVERGEINISLGNIERIATALGVDLTDLLRPQANAPIDSRKLQQVTP